MLKLLTRTIVRIPVVTIAIVDVQLLVTIVPVAVHQITIGPKRSRYIPSSISPNILSPKYLRFPTVAGAVLHLTITEVSMHSGMQAVSYIVAN